MHVHKFTHVYHKKKKKSRMFSLINILWGLKSLIKNIEISQTNPTCDFSMHCLCSFKLEIGKMNNSDKYFFIRARINIYRLITSILGGKNNVYISKL